jgi:hypothetical protein
MSANNIVTVELENGDNVKVYVRSPTRKMITSADMHRAKTWNNCLVEGIITKMELDLVLRKRGIWDDEKDDQQKKMIEDISNMEKSLYLDDKKRTIEEGKDLAVKIRIARNKLRGLLGSRIAFEENTAESIADNARFNYLVAECVYNEANDKKVYNNLEDYEEKGGEPIALAAAGKLAEMLYNIDENFEATLPENKWLKRFDLVDDKLNMVNKEGQLIDVEGRRINDKGQYIDDLNNVVDKDGNKLEEDGNYFMTAVYEEETPKKRGRAKKIVSGE